MAKKLTIIISGPTAAGKTAVAAELCKRINGEIISADSRQVYKYLDIGTNKDGVLEDWKIDEDLKLQKSIRSIDGVKQYLTDIIEPDKKYSAKNFETDAEKYENFILKRGKTPVIAGGTGLYIKAFLYGLDDLPDADEKIRTDIENIIKDKGLGYLYDMLYKIDAVSAEKNKGNTQRLIRAYEIYKITGKTMSELLADSACSKKDKNRNFRHFVLIKDREKLYSAINRRCEDMINNGMIEETEKLLKAGYRQDCYGLTGVGYKHIVKYLNNEISKQQLINSFAQDTRQYAKRQITWFTHQKDAEIINTDNLSANDIAEKIINNLK